MTAKEKAQELVTKYSGWAECLAPSKNGYVVDINLHRYNAKEGALACVQEIKSTMIDRYIDYKEQVDETDWKMCHSYWVDVAIEIYSL